jgi:hypothetical protein
VFIAEAKLKEGVSLTASLFVKTAIQLVKAVKIPNVSGAMIGKDV